MRRGEGPKVELRFLISTKMQSNREDAVDLRLLVHQSQAGCVIGRGGYKIKELREGAPPKGSRQNYDARNVDESMSLEYGGWGLGNHGSGLNLVRNRNNVANTNYAQVSS
ncbi:unnamed protein product [Trichobilharzia regenti]|nr:unnamed protein product [Trichobilharzia regenti]